jgi:hypothetical protein
MTLCHLCERIQPPHEVAPGLSKEDQHFCFVRHHETFAELIKSAKDGCELCLLFRPFVERGDDDSSLTSGESVTDPFEDDSNCDCAQCRNDDLLKFKIDEGVYYVENGESSYRRVYRKHDPARKALYDYESNDGDDEPYYHTGRNNELLQWLKLVTGSKTSQEQLWVTIGGLEDDDTWSWSQETSKEFLTITAGSVSRGAFGCSDATYCLEGRQYPDAKSLAWKEPVLFTEPARELTLYREGQKAFWPYFEFFERRGEMFL